MHKEPIEGINKVPFIYDACVMPYHYTVILTNGGYI